MNEGAPERRSEAQRELARLEQTVADLTVQLAETKAELHKARALAAVDPRSGFLTERAIHERLAYEIARAARFRRELAVIVAGCDEDALLELSDVCRTTARATDVVGLSAPGEVMLVLPETPNEGALVLAERLRTRAPSLKARFGSAEWPRDAGDARGAAELLAAARRALRSG